MARGSNEYQTKMVRLEQVVKFIRNYDRGTVDKRNRRLIADAVRKEFMR